MIFCFTPKVELVCEDLWKSAVSGASSSGEMILWIFFLSFSFLKSMKIWSMDIEHDLEEIRKTTTDEQNCVMQWRSICSSKPDLKHKWKVAASFSVQMITENTIASMHTYLWRIVDRNSKCIQHTNDIFCWWLIRFHIISHDPIVFNQYQFDRKIYINASNEPSPLAHIYTYISSVNSEHTQMETKNGERRKTSEKKYQQRSSNWRQCHEIIIVTSE